VNNELAAVRHNVADGRDVCCELRRSAHAQKTRIVALTRHVDLKGSSWMSDFDGCIVKPITMQALEDLLGTATTRLV
jgi:DNA-binding response OmpR family regulator